MELATWQLYALLVFFALCVISPVIMLTYVYITRGSWKHVATVAIYAFFFGSSFPGGVYLHKLGVIPWHPYVYVVFVWMLLSLLHLRVIKPHLEE